MFWLLDVPLHPAFSTHLWKFFELLHVSFRFGNDLTVNFRSSCGGTVG